MNGEELFKEVAIKKHWYSNFPKWLKITLLVISIITMIYWLGLVIYKILCAIRVFGAFIFDKRNYWTFLVCVLILVIGSLLIAQFYLGLNPFGKTAQWFIDQYNNIRNVIGNKISG